MKKLKQIIGQIKEISIQPTDNNLIDLLWQLICYPPKMPLRLHQEHFLHEAAKFSVLINDIYFTKKHLRINGFKWGNGPFKVLVTHGWGSKAADFVELITTLKQNEQIQIIAFDAPANGSSEGELSNLLLFAEAVKAVIGENGSPDIVIGHSLGTMANVIALTDLGITPKLLISIAPFILLQENFIKSMTAAGVSQQAQAAFFQSFEERYGVPASYFNMQDIYKFDAALNHWLAYDGHDRVLPIEYLEKFLEEHPTIRSHNYADTGHEKIIRSVAVIEDIVTAINKILAV